MFGKSLYEGKNLDKRLESSNHCGQQLSKQKKRDSTRLSFYICLNTDRFNTCFEMVKEKDLCKNRTDKGYILVQYNKS